VQDPNTFKLLKTALSVVGDEAAKAETQSIY